MSGLFFFINKAKETQSILQVQPSYPYYNGRIFVNKKAGTL